MVESEKQEMKFIDGIDLNEKDVISEFDNIIELELNDSMSLIYSKNEKRYYIEYLDYDNGFDEFTYELDEFFDGITLQNVTITKEDFEEFKSLVNSVI